MSDPRLRRWAQVLVRYSVGVQPGDRFMIATTPQAAPLVEEVYREALRVGAHPEVMIELPAMQEIWLREASEAQLKDVPPVLKMVMSEYNATLQITADENTQLLANADPAKQAMQQQALSEPYATFMRRQATGDL